MQDGIKVDRTTQKVSFPRKLQSTELITSKMQGGIKVDRTTQEVSFPRKLQSTKLKNIRNSRRY